MARTVEEIQAEITAQKEADPVLAGLTSQSVSAVWRRWVVAWSYATHTLERLWDAFRAEVDATIAARRLGTPAWYAATAVAFQLGDEVDQFGQYPLPDVSKRIITKASFKEALDGTLVLKVAKTVGGVLQALSGAELGQFREYMAAVKFAGTRLSCVSLNADQLRYTARVYYEGQRTETVVREAVRAAIRARLLAVPFDGVLLQNELVEAVRAVEGVRDVEFSSLAAAQGEEVIPVGRAYESRAGYIVAGDESFVMIPE